MLLRRAALEVRRLASLANFRNEARNPRYSDVSLRHYFQSVALYPGADAERISTPQKSDLPSAGNSCGLQPSEDLTTPTGFVPARAIEALSEGLRYPRSAHLWHLAANVRGYRGAQQEECNAKSEDEWDLPHGGAPCVCVLNRHQS